MKTGVTHTSLSVSRSAVSKANRTCVWAVSMLIVPLLIDILIEIIAFLAASTSMQVVDC